MNISSKEMNILKKKTLQKKNIIFQNKLIDQKFTLRIMRQKLKTLKIAHDWTRNVRKSITSFFVLFSSFVNHITKMIANINASNQFEKIKQSIVFRIRQFLSRFCTLQIYQGLKLDSIELDLSSFTHTSISV
jgi:hypothetical protein